MPGRTGAETANVRALYSSDPFFYSIKPAAGQATPQPDMQKGRLKTSASMK
ncbi:hypothetical protein ACTHSL_03660 [Neisseria sp. P0008.S010]|uniref:hypothetical protein n=1 Tax=Neisseria sp. P0008.S010 TaxID=3436707 RepID=UPI003F7ED002